LIAASAALAAITDFGLESAVEAVSELFDFLTSLTTPPFRASYLASSSSLSLRLAAAFSAIYFLWFMVFSWYSLTRSRLSML
jgi:hypothetical protein